MEVYRSIVLLLFLCVCKSQGFIPIDAYGPDGVGSVDIRLSKVESMQQMMDDRVQSMTQSLMTQVTILHNRAKTAEGMIQGLVRGSLSTGYQLKDTKETLSRLQLHFDRLQNDMTAQLRTLTEANEQYRKELTSVKESKPDKDLKDTITSLKGEMSELREQMLGLLQGTTDD